MLSGRDIEEGVGWSCLFCKKQLLAETLAVIGILSNEEAPEENGGSSHGPGDLSGERLFVPPLFRGTNN
jgi:hypothetical protein